jgi:hypothetical protein
MNSNDDFERNNRIKEHRRYFLYPSKARRRMALLRMPLTLASGFIEFVLFDKSGVAKLGRYGMMIGFGVMLIAIFSHFISRG